MDGIYTSSDPYAVIDVPPFERNTTDWVRIDIADVSGSVVHQVYTLHFKNGVETKFELQTDLDPRNAGDCYFDKKTGVPFEIYRVHKFTNKVTGETVEKTDIVKMTRSNLWAPKETKITTVPPTLTTIITATSLLTTIVARKHNLTKKHGSRKNPV